MLTLFTKPVIFVLDKGFHRYQMCFTSFNNGSRNLSIDAEQGGKMIERKIQHQFSEGDVGLLGAAIERKCKIECCTKCARSMAHLGPTDELPPVVTDQIYNDFVLVA